MKSDTRKQIFWVFPEFLVARHHWFEGTNFPCIQEVSVSSRGQKAKCD